MQSTRFKVGWIMLLIISILMALQHLVLIFAIMDEAVLFIGWTAFNLYSSIALYIPFRRGERWAWLTTWIMVLAFAPMILFDPQIAVIYVTAAVLIAVGLLLTRGAFFGGTRTT
jgi:hypothetical protein